jgi:hypothetical protein
MHYVSFGGVYFGRSRIIRSQICFRVYWWASLVKYKDPSVEYWQTVKAEHSPTPVLSSQSILLPTQPVYTVALAKCNTNVKHDLQDWEQKQLIEVEPQVACASIDLHTWRAIVLIPRSEHFFLSDLLASAHCMLLTEHTTAYNIQLITVAWWNILSIIYTQRFTFTFIHLADAFIQSDLQLLHMSEVARLWSN